MGPRNLHHIRKQRSRPVSIASEDELETGVHVSPAGASPPYPESHAQSHSGSSSRGEPFVHLSYPGELPEEREPVYPYDSASRTASRPQASRTTSARREAHRRTQPALRQRQRPQPSDSSSESEESGDSAEDFLGQPDYAPGMPRPQSYYGPNGYTHSSSSGSYGYPPIPQSNQMVAYAAPQQQHPHYQQHPHQYPPMSSPQGAGYPGPQGFHPADPRARHEANNHANPHYRQSPYGPAPMVPYGPQGYFPPYPGQPQYPHPYHPGGPAPYLPPFMHEWQVASHSRKASPPPDKKGDERAMVPAPPPGPPQPSQEEIIQKMQEMLIASSAEREKKEAERQLKIQSAEDRVAAIRKAEAERAIEEGRIRADAVRLAKEQAEAAALAQAERAANEDRIRQEAMRTAEKMIADRAAADAERVARETRIREEAARDALEKAAAEAKAKADQQAREAKIAADAAEAAKTAAEKKAAEDLAAKEAAAKTEKEEAEKKMKEAEEAAAKAKAEAEAAQAAAAAAKPPDKKPPVRFKDAIGRNYNFPWERCCKWRDMENLINQAFQHIEDLGEHVLNGRYDLIGPDKEIIMPQYWDYIVQPDMHITMMLWPLPEKPKIEDINPLPDPLAPPGPPPDGVIDLDLLLNPGRNKKKDKGKKPIGNSFSNWMLGGVPSRTRKSIKAYKT